MSPFQDSDIFLYEIVREKHDENGELSNRTNGNLNVVDSFVFLFKVDTLNTKSLIIPERKYL